MFHSIVGIYYFVIQHLEKKTFRKIRYFVKKKFLEGVMNFSDVCKTYYNTRQFCPEGYEFNMLERQGHLYMQLPLRIQKAYRYYQKCGSPYSFFLETALRVTYVALTPIGNLGLVLKRIGEFFNKKGFARRYYAMGTFEMGRIYRYARYKNDEEALGWFGKAVYYYCQGFPGQRLLSYSDFLKPLSPFLSEFATQKNLIQSLFPNSCYRIYLALSGRKRSDFVNTLSGEQLTHLFIKLPEGFRAGFLTEISPESSLKAMLLFTAEEHFYKKH